MACADGMSARAAALHFGISRDSVRKMLSFSVPPGYRRQAAINRPKLDGFTEIIDAWLAEDRGRNRKQRGQALAKRRAGTATVTMMSMRFDWRLHHRAADVKDYIRKARA